ncbi:hypothetical protein BLNAU_19512 [Blattamonas nauphoetae]|uniref:Uncharacterized protein n=1 Tax=Blattamonas nauphoetae TaxID=2049346 RepID=A0ABQ9X1J1_9EUKA|nr:hypothetical protein BLNAU_19512 [Blattamonas nauphoetae]
MSAPLSHPSPPLPFLVCVEFKQDACHGCDTSRGSNHTLLSFSFGRVVARLTFSFRSIPNQNYIGIVASSAEDILQALNPVSIQRQLQNALIADCGGQEGQEGVGGRGEEVPGRYFNFDTFSIFDNYGNEEQRRS